jgi:4a-hydroxytetrahydrobiopterin dehydratase
VTEVPQELTTAGWSISKDGLAIEKSYKFKNFRAAMAWMMRAAFEAEAVNHHPEWFNVYSRIDVRLTTHDSGGLSEKDIDLAHRFEQI